MFGGKDFDRNQLRPRAGASLLYRTDTPLFFVQIEPSQNGTQNHVVVEFTRVAILKLAVNVLHVGLIGGV